MLYLPIFTIERVHAFCNCTHILKVNQWHHVFIYSRATHPHAHTRQHESQTMSCTEFALRPAALWAMVSLCCHLFCSVMSWWTSQQSVTQTLSLQTTTAASANRWLSRSTWTLSYQEREGRNQSLCSLFISLYTQIAFLVSEAAYGWTEEYIKKIMELKEHLLWLLHSILMDAGFIWCINELDGCKSQ